MRREEPRRCRKRVAGASAVLAGSFVWMVGVCCTPPVGNVPTPDDLSAPQPLDDAARARAGDLGTPAADWSGSVVDSVLAGTGVSAGANTRGDASALAGPWTAALNDADTGKSNQVQMGVASNGAATEMQLFSDELTQAVTLTVPSGGHTGKATATGRLLGSLVSTADGVLFDIRIVAALDTTEDGVTVRTREVYQFVVSLLPDGAMLVGLARRTSEVIASNDPDRPAAGVSQATGSTSLVRNRPPGADAGLSQTVVVGEGSDVASVTLDGSDSWDTDGEIIAYAWSVAGRQIAWSPRPTVDLDVGTHTISLRVTDNDGAVGTDQIVVAVARDGGGGDACPTDPDKTDPGVCGYGQPDTDTDGDGTLDCADECPNDAEKTAAGACGCGEAETPDTDEDGTVDCADACPADPLKTDAGVCGCGLPDTDVDGDGTPDCEPAGPPIRIPSRSATGTPADPAEASANVGQAVTVEGEGLVEGETTVTLPGVDLNGTETTITVTPDTVAADGTSLVFTVPAPAATGVLRIAGQGAGKILQIVPCVTGIGGGMGRLTTLFGSGFIEADTTVRFGDVEVVDAGPATDDGIDVYDWNSQNNRIAVTAPADGTLPYEVITSGGSSGQAADVTDIPTRSDTGTPANAVAGSANVGQRVTIEGAGFVDGVTKVTLEAMDHNGVPYITTVDTDTVADDGSSLVFTVPPMWNVRIVS